ncbi:MULTISPECIES: relaxase/mobilization nuclease domain-containing protein [Flagellimonas]|uniref:relaxase/mobilization nuclease domain-containing protein n=1 Tax=Flagellimonas TaxID=444459 RepID=UPI0038508F71
MGFDNKQFIKYRHTDTEHQHIHIIASKVRYSGKLTSDCNIKRRNQKALNDFIKKYGLTQILRRTKTKSHLPKRKLTKH